MSANALSRRNLFRAGACALAGPALLTEVARADASGAEASANEAVIRKWYKMWLGKDGNWGPFSAMLADDFTFSKSR